MTSVVAKNNGDDVTLINPGGGNSMMWHNIRTDVAIHPTPSSLQTLPDMDNKENMINDVHQNGELNPGNGKSPIVKVEILNRTSDFEQSQNCGITNYEYSRNDICKEGTKDFAIHDILDNDMSNDNFASIINLANLADSIDVYSLMQAVEAKILENFTSWDLMIRRARLYQLTTHEENTMGVIQFLVTEIESLLSQISDVLTECMAPYVDDNKLVDSNIQRCKDEFVDISELFSAALGLVRGTWKRTKKIEDIPVRFRNLFEAIDIPISELSENGNVRPKKAKLTRRKRLKKKHTSEICDDNKGVQTIGSIELKDSNQFDGMRESRDFDEKADDAVATEDNEPRQYSIKRKKLLRTGKNKKGDCKAKLIDFVRDIENYDKDKEYKLVCEVCGTPILNEQVMSKHKTYCNGMSQTRINYEQVSAQGFQCRMGSCVQNASQELSDETLNIKTFETESDVITHCYLHHYDDVTRASVCQECGIKFATPKHRVKHFARVHDKKYICSMCGKRFFREALLADHMVTHTGEKVIVFTSSFLV